jgi:hypothetical protein
MSEKLPESLLEFEAQFADEEACIAFLRGRRWGGGFRCPRCGGTRAWQLRARPLDQCVECGHQVSLTAGTVFEGTRKPLRIWFRVMGELLFSKAGCSALEISRRFELRYGTAWTWLHKLRSAMDRSWGNPLDGLIEVDETYLGGADPAEKRGRSLAGKKMLVAGAAECRGKAIGRIRLRAIPAASSAVLCAFVANSIVAGSLVKTDGQKGYMRVASNGYQHQRVIVGNPRRASRFFPRVHRVFSLLDRWILGTLQGSISLKHLQRYLDEFVFRFNRRSSLNRWLLFDRLLAGAFKHAPPTYSELVAAWIVVT